MATCFLNNVYCCYLPAHCSHGLQPLDNGIFNATKAAYRKELEKLASLTDSTPVDKVNFIRAYAKAREIGFTEKNIRAGWRVTGNWPISRAKALRHPEIQEDKREVTPEPPQIIGPDETPRTSRHIRDLGVDHSPSTRRNYAKIAKAFEAQETALSAAKARIASLEEEVARLKRGKKRKAVPNPNRRFMDVAEALVAGDPIPPIRGAAELEVEVQEEELVVVGAPESHSEDDDESEIESQIVHTRSGRAIKKPRRYYI